MARAALPGVAFVLMLLASGCSGSEQKAGADTEPDTELSETADPESSAPVAMGSCPDSTEGIQDQIFARRCSDSGCHSGEQPAASLDLMSPGVESRIAMVVGLECQDRIVSPGEHEYSMLWKKVRYDDPGCGERMPAGGPPLEDWEIDCLASWIDAMPMPTESPEPSGRLPTQDAAPPPACDDGLVLCGRTCIEEPEPTLDALFEAVWFPSCGQSTSCHRGSNPKEYLWLDTPEGVMDMVDTPAIQRPEVDLVEPGSPEDSYVVMKLRAEGMSEKSSTGLTSMQMPRLAPPLCEPLIAAVEEWIALGAPAN